MANKKYEIRTTTFRYGKIGNLLGIKTKEVVVRLSARITPFLSNISPLLASIGKSLLHKSLAKIDNFS